MNVSKDQRYRDFTMLVMVFVGLLNTAVHVRDGWWFPELTALDASCLFVCCVVFFRRYYPTRP